MVARGIPAGLPRHCPRQCVRDREYRRSQIARCPCSRTARVIGKRKFRHRVGADHAGVEMIRSRTGPVSCAMTWGGSGRESAPSEKASLSRNGFDLGWTNWSRRQPANIRTAINSGKITAGVGGCAGFISAPRKPAPVLTIPEKIWFLSNRNADRSPQCKGKTGRWSPV